MKIPTNAKIVFKGVLCDVYHWKETNFDGTKSTWEGIKRKPAVQLFVKTTENKWVFLHEEQPGNRIFKSVPGGLIDENEEPLAAAKRELLEETGMTGTFKYIGTHNLPRGIVEFSEHFYIVTDAKIIQKQKVDAGEKIKIELLELDDFIKQINKDSFRNPKCRNYLDLLK